MSPQYGIKKVICKNGGIGHWLYRRDRQRIAAIWISVGRPIVWVPDIIWQRMNPVKGLETILDAGVMWLLFAIRITVQQKATGT